MFRLARFVLLVACSAGAVSLGGCGNDDPATEAVAGTSYKASEVCSLLAVEAVAEVLPGAKIDTALPTPYSCFYAADGGDVILTATSPDRVMEDSPDRGPGTERITTDEMYDMALSGATDNGADDVREFPSIGTDGKVAVNAGDAEITAVWRRGDEVYDVQFSFWDGSPSDAVDIAKQLAKAVRPLS